MNIALQLYLQLAYITPVGVGPGAVANVVWIICHGIAFVVALYAHALAAAALAEQTAVAEIERIVHSEIDL